MKWNIAAPALAPEVADGNQFRRDVLRGLCTSAKEVPCKYLYDDAGSQLFEQICALPEYYPTRTELQILQLHASEMAEALGPQCLLIEYGSGSSCKTRLLLDQLRAPAGYVPVDIARRQLEEACDSLASDYPWLHIQPLCADFTQPLHLPETVAGRPMIYFPGSTIGNFQPSQAVTLLRQTARFCATGGGGLLLGVDLKKEPRIVNAAYNDAAGVTAAFNLNLLVRINRELGGNFQLERFWHHAFYNPAESRIEMHLVSSQEQEVNVDGQRICFAEGESICTEFSYKYSPSDLSELAAASGFRIQAEWVDAQRYFAVQYWVVN